MPRTVADGITLLLQWNAPVAAEVAAARSHARTIEQGLRAEFPSFNRLEIMGSHTRDTAIHLFSDVDYLAVLGVADVRWGDDWRSSSTILGKVKSALQARFPGTDVWVNGPAVVVGFKQGTAAVDVVPGVWTGTTGIDGYPVFAIPDGNGGWLKTSPQRHSKYINESNTAAGGKLVPVIRLLKIWKYSREPSVPVLGFHLELLLAAEKVCVGVLSYRECLLESFRLLRDRGGAALNDPLQISPRIPATTSAAKAEALTNNALYAVDHARRAIEAELSGDIQESFRQWGLVFNGNFPAYR